LIFCSALARLGSLLLQFPIDLGGHRETDPAFREIYEVYWDRTKLILPYSGAIKSFYERCGSTLHSVDDPSGERRFGWRSSSRDEDLFDSLLKIHNSYSIDSILSSSRPYRGRAWVSWTRRLIARSVAPPCQRQ
jgi:hypothetical protein